jgi:alpha-tubulin suppressor-like RCC1 family protein
MCSLNGDGTVWCWGSDTFGQVGDGVMNTSAPPTQLTVLGDDVTSISSFNVGVCAVKADGAIWCWGQYFNNTISILTPAPLSSFVCDGKSPAPIIQ